MPAPLDLQLNGYRGLDFGADDLSQERLAGICRAYRADGGGRFLATVITDSLSVLEHRIGALADCLEADATIRDTVAGIHVEGPFINRKNAGAQNPQFVRPPNFGELRAIDQIAKVCVVSLAPELDGALELITAAKALGITTSAAHTSAGAAQLRAAMAAGLTHLTHFCNAMTPLHHREIGVVGAGLIDDGLMLELICDTIHLSPDMLKLVLQVVPIERLMLITDSMAASWVADGETSLGGLAVVVKDGAARLKDGGALAGSTLLFNQGLRNLANLVALPLHQLVKTTSWNQARSLGLPGLGQLAPGFFADIVILNPDFSVWKTLVDGEER